MSYLSNTDLFHVAADTPMGQLLRSYWTPIATSSEICAGAARSVEVFGDRMALFRTPDGELALLEDRCPHRGASLSRGIVSGEGLRCPYHGWLFDGQGRCREQPNEDRDHGFHLRVQQPAFRATELGGLVFAYLSSSAAPPIPRFDLLVDPTLNRRIRTAIIPVNWLQIAENGLDPAHLEWLHGHLKNYLLELEGNAPKYDVARHVELEFEPTDLGIVKRRTVVDQSKAEEDWSIGQLAIFPSSLYIASPRQRAMHFRVPLDDVRTWHIWYETTPALDGGPATTTVEEARIVDPDTGEYDKHSIDGQDVMAWVSQGPVHDRSRERLGEADKGIILFRRLLAAEAMVVQDGGRPRWSDLGETTIVLPKRTSGSPVLRDLAF